MLALILAPLFISLSKPTADGVGVMAAPALKSPLTASQKPQELATRIYVAQAPSGVVVTFNNTYDWGQCVWGVANWTSVPGDWGNANQWDDNARLQGYTVSAIPKVGAIAQTDGGYYGHVSLVESVNTDGSVTVKEMNFEGLGVTDERTTPITDWVYIYI